MFDLILHPIASIRMIRHIADELTPENLAELKAAKTKDEKAKIEERITKEIFPELA